MRTNKVMPVALPLELSREAEGLARRQRCTKSELVREALRRYVADSRWRELQEFGRAQTRKLGIKEADIEPKEKLSVIQADEPDNRVLECALAAKASIIVSGD